MTRRNGSPAACASMVLMRWITAEQFNLSRVKAFYSDHFVLPLPEGHKFPMAKYAGLRERILAEGIVQPGDLHEAPAAGWEHLGLVHDAGYVDAVAAGTLPREVQRRIGFPWSPQMVERSRRSVGATIAAARAALDEGVAANLAGGTHHSFADRGEGFCIFNDVAVAARVLQRDRDARRITVVDLDVHQGNGTAAIFAGDESVFTFSMHGEKNFPFRKEASDLDVPLADGTGDDEYLALLRQHLGEVLNRHQPDFVFYLAGADPYEGDRLGRLKMTIGGLRERDEIVFAECRRRGLPVAVTMSGGYATDVDAIITIHANTIRTAAEIWANSFAS
jgi:acetoin utilization deacetylase AcuC-like enzyme